MTLISTIAAAPRSAATSSTPAPATAAAPVEPRPTTAKFSIGGAIGGGVGGLALGGVGGAILGAMMDAGTQAGWMGGSGMMWGAVGGLVLGGAIGAIWAGEALGNYNLKDAQQKYDAKVGSPSSELATRMIQPFDHDNSGSIEIGDRTGIPSMDERVIIDKQIQHRSEPYFDVWNNEWKSRDVSTPMTDTKSAARVWTDADANHDDTVTPDELAKLIDTADANHDGRITADEQGIFNDAHPIIDTGWQVG